LSVDAETRRIAGPKSSKPVLGKNKLKFYDLENMPQKQKKIWFVDNKYSFLDFSCGLVVKAEDSGRRGLRFKSPLITTRELENIFRNHL
jgi:hypothetical protein